MIGEVVTTMSDKRLTQLESEIQFIKEDTNKISECMLSLVKQQAEVTNIVGDVKELVKEIRDLKRDHKGHVEKQHDLELRIVSNETKWKYTTGIIIFIIVPVVIAVIKYLPQ